MAEKLKNTHDALFKSILSDINRAREFLEVVLPPALREKFNMHTLSDTGSTFITDDWKDLFADMVFKVGITNDKHANQVYVSLLFEHKSYKDKNVHFQILSYLSNAYLKQSRSGKKLEPIVPVIFYSGKTKWQLNSIDELFGGVFIDYYKFIPDYQNVMIDLAAMSEESIFQISQAWIRSILMVQKFSKHPK